MAISNHLIHAFEQDNPVVPTPSRQKIKASEPNKFKEVYGPVLLGTSLKLQAVWFITGYCYIGLQFFMPIILKGKSDTSMSVEQTYIVMII
jgi:hypothetical protein